MQANDARAFAPFDAGEDLRRADPRGFASADGVAYLSDGSSGAILRVAGEHVRRLATIQLDDSEVGSIGGIALGPDGSVFATQLGHPGTIHWIAPDGEITTLAKLP